MTFTTFKGMNEMKIMNSVINLINLMNTELRIREIRTPAHTRSEIGYLRGVSTPC